MRYSLDTSFFVLKPHPGAEKDLGPVPGKCVNNRNMFEPVFEVMDPRIDFTKLFLAIDVLRVFRTSSPPQQQPQALQSPRAASCAKGIETRRRDVSCLRRYILGSRFLGRTISAHEMNIRQWGQGIKADESAETRIDYPCEEMKFLDLA